MKNQIISPLDIVESGGQRYWRTEGRLYLPEDIDEKPKVTEMLELTAEERIVEELAGQGKVLRKRKGIALVEEPTTLEKITTGAREALRRLATPKNLAYAAGVACMVLAPGVALSDENPTPHKVFAGTMATENVGVDTLLTYDHANGASVHVEANDKIWTPETSNLLSLGLRSPKFLNDLFRISGALDFDEDFEDWGYSAFLESFPVDGLTLRAGAIQSSEDILGGFLGGKYLHENFTIDADAWHDGTEIQGRGFAAGVIPFGKAGDLYLSVGGDLSRDMIHTLTGWMNPGGFGVFNRVSFDLENESQSGQILIADQSTYKKGKFDFKQHVYNGTEMRYTTTGLILDGWAPFPAYHTENLGLRVDWHNSADSSGASGMAYYRPTPEIFMGLGAGDDFDKKVNDHHPNARVELYAKIIGPLEAWANLPIDLETGKMTPTLYIGGSGSF